MAAHIKKIHAANEKTWASAFWRGRKWTSSRTDRSTTPMKSWRSSTWWFAQSILISTSTRGHDRAHARGHRKSYTQIIAHPTGRLLLRRDAFDYDMEKVLDACAKHGVAMECNSYPDRLDLKDVYLRMCKERGVKVAISTDSHNTANLSFIRYGVTMARRGWLEKKDVINTLPTEQFWRNSAVSPAAPARNTLPRANASALLQTRPARDGFAAMR